ncbi:MAG: lipid A biosynthesis acyltransferase, partial [Pseudomonadota bacterium]
ALTCATYMKPDGTGFEIVFGEPLKDFPSGNDKADTTAMNAAIENCITQAPDQYLWVHKRFKTRPPGEPSLYN